MSHLITQYLPQVNPCRQTLPNSHYTYMTHLITQYLPQVNPCRQTLPNSHYTYMTHLITQYLPQVNPCRQTLPKLPLYIHDPPHYTIPTSRQPLYTDTTYTPIIHTWPTSLHNTYPKSTPVDKHYLNTIIRTCPTSLHNTYLKAAPVNKHCLNSHYTYMSHLITQYLPLVNPCRQTLPINSHYTYMSHLITQYLPQVNPCRQTLPILPLYAHVPPHYTIPTPSQPL